ncbi:MAG: choice-of-anchor D domain-containing protein [Terriglobales bacterium]|jgi:hypothetical protein
MRLPRSLTPFLAFRGIHFLTLSVAIVLLAFTPVPARAGNSQLVAMPNRLGFGDVAVGQSENALVTLTNTGLASVTVSGVSESDSEFTTSSLNLPLVLSAGESVEVGVTFKPATTGWQGGVVKFSNNAGNTILQFEVGGSGVNSLALTASPAAVSFGQVAIGTLATAPVVLTNDRPWNVTLSTLRTVGSGFSVTGPALPLTLGVGQSVTVNVSFAPQSAGTDAGTLFVTGPLLAIPLSGVGAASGQLADNPASLAFGSVQVGANITLTDSLTNAGGSSVTISQATVMGAGFSMSGLNPPLVLNPGASITFSAIFTPSSAANATGAITINSNASNSTLTVALSGTGTAQGQLVVAPTSVNFGSVAVGNTVNQSSSLSAGGASVTVSGVSLNSAEFSLTGVSFPVTIAAGQSLPVTLSFTPQTSGTANATLSVNSNAANNPAQNLTGVGTQTQHSVALSWTDNSSGVAGYNVYRGSVSGGPFAQINSGLALTPSYTDNTVISGQTYYYVATAVSESGAESAYSNVAEGVIPTP